MTAEEPSRRHKNNPGCHKKKRSTGAKTASVVQAPSRKSKCGQDRQQRKGTQLSRNARNEQPHGSGD
jgi:hypothetical protein